MIKKEEIIKTASQARINISPKEVEELIPQVKEILEFFSTLSKANTKNVKETMHPIHVQDRFREDKVGESLSQEEALKNTKNKKDGYFLGPKTK